MFVKRSVVGCQMNIEDIYGACQVTFGINTRFLAHIQWKVKSQEIAMCMFEQTEFVENIYFKTIRFAITEFQLNQKATDSDSMFKFIHTRYYVNKDKALKDFLSRSSVLPVLSKT
jgi:hypothetical protein